MILTWLINTSYSDKYLSKTSTINLDTYTIIIDSTIMIDITTFVLVLLYFHYF